MKDVSLLSFPSKTRHHLSFGLLIMKRSDGKEPKYTISISKKAIKKAVNRNHIKRRLRVLLEALKDHLQCDILLIVSSSALDTSFSQMKHELSTVVSSGTKS